MNHQTSATLKKKKPGHSRLFPSTKGSKNDKIDKFLKNKQTNKTLFSY